MSSLLICGLVLTVGLLTLACPAAAWQVMVSEHPVRYGNFHKHFFSQVESSELKLEGAGNEVVAFQILITDFGDRLHSLTVKQLPFLGPEPNSTPKMELFELEDCQNGLAPDCLVPMTSPSLEISPTNNHLGYKAIWCDIAIASNTRPGTYTGAIEITTDDPNTQHRQIPISLTVHPFSLPDVPTLKADLNNYGVKFVKEWGVTPGSVQALEIVRRFYKLARQHRMTLNPLPYKSQRGTPFIGMAPELEGQGHQMRVRDWRGYDAFYGPLFDGSAFGNGVPVDHQYLPFNPQWPSDFSLYYSDRDRYEIQWQRIGREFIRHFEQRGWNRTTFQIFLNQRPSSNNQIPWHLDEPKGDSDYQALRYFALLTHNAFATDGNSRLNFRFRIDISHFYCDKHKGNPKKDFRVNNGWEILEPVDTWVISKHSMDSPYAQKMAQKLVEKGKTVYEYMAGNRMPLLTDPLTTGLASGWNAWLRREHGILFWNSVRYGQANSNGKDFLIYSRDHLGNPKPVPSIRLKAIRRGIQDHDYFYLGSRFGNVDSLIRKYMTRDPRDYTECRKQISKMILDGMRGQ